VILIKLISNISRIYFGSSNEIFWKFYIEKFEKSMFLVKLNKIYKGLAVCVLSVKRVIYNPIQYILQSWQLFIIGFAIKFPVNGHEVTHEFKYRYFPLLHPVHDVDVPKLQDAQAILQPLHVPLLL
jgi:hypothetical protein